MRHFSILFCLLNATQLIAQVIPAAKPVVDEFIFTQAPFRQCHASSLVALPDNGLLAAWFGGTHERHPDVCIWGAIKTGSGWSAPRLLADGIVNDTLRYPCWNPVLFRMPDGRLNLYYKVGPSPETWTGWYKTSADNGQSWSAPTALPNGILGPIKNKPISMPGVIISPSSTEHGNQWHAHMEISTDNGLTWSLVSIDTTTGYKLIQPALLQLRDGTLLALMRSNQNCLVESRSTDKGQTWTRPAKTTVLNPNSGIDALTLRNGQHLLVYNPARSGSDWSDGRNQLVVAASPDGTHWQDIFQLENQSSGEFSYPAIIQTDDGLVHITYTHNRTAIRHTVLKY